jgi:hypothetical protein
MMLRDVPVDVLEALQAGEEAEWDVYRMRYFPGKSFYVAHINLTTDERIESMTLWDVWGFFQSSFVAALREWKIGSTELIAKIERMKQSRGMFRASERTSIKGYCIDECVQLTNIMEEVARTLIDAGIFLTRWDGAGAVGGALLGKHGIKRYTAGADETKMRDVLLHAYFGGRVETFGVGVCETECYAYDINSAYPAQAAELPNCVGSWSHMNEHAMKMSLAATEWVKYADAVWRVRWTCDTEQQIAPFPFRNPDGDIYWASQGEGWYHAVEVQAAIDCLPQYTYEIVEGWIFTPADDSKPFAWVQDVYEERLVYKRVGDARHIILKLGLNSMYGKLAQTIAMFGRTPPYQNFYYAGRITAGTRAAMLRAMVTTDPTNLIASATDGIFTRAPLTVTESKKLGEWDVKTIEAGLLVAQPGVMVTPERQHVRTRGFAKGGIDYATFYDAWMAVDVLARVHVQETRFHGMGRALMEGMRNWRRWVESEHVIGFTTYPKKSFHLEQQKAYKPKRYPYLYRGPLVMWRLLFCEHKERGQMSAPYNKHTVYDADRRKGEQHEHEQPDEAPTLWP